MTADARQQAEQIVDEYGLAIGHTWQEAIARGGTSEETVDHVQEVRDALVQALAAAIEETESEDDLRGHALRDEAAIEKNRRLARATEARREALSALGVEVE